MTSKIVRIAPAGSPPGIEYGVEKRLFHSLDHGNKGYIFKKDLEDNLLTAGFTKYHTSMQTIFDKLAQLEESNKINFEKFVELTKENLTLIEKALTLNLIIPDFPEFSSTIDDIYHLVKKNKSGKVANYIPQLSRISPNLFGVSLCTIDGQIHSIGDSNTPFSAQSTSKPINYCVAQNELGEDEVHKYIGKEPSGHRFNVLRLNENNLPHNPFINSGAIMACSLIQREMNPADRFDYIMQTWTDMAGGLKPGFNNSIYLSEKSTADRNYAIAYFMQEHKAFPPNTNLNELLELYFQCCSIEVTTLHMSIIAATLANAGVCPLTQKQIFPPNIVKNCLSLMYSCGLYDFSGEFAFTVGLPGKSGISGCIILVVPNVMGICIYSPPIDHFGNSVRGLAFSNELIKRYNFHIYDSLIRTTNKSDPCRRSRDDTLSGVMSLIWAASQGDLAEIKRLVALGVDLNGFDYDKRTALHLAASEGQIHVVTYLLQHGAMVNPVDRWGATPLTDALRRHHKKLVKTLEEYGATSKF